MSLQNTGCLKKRKGKPEKSKLFFLFAEPLKSLEKKRNKHKKGKENRKRKKARKSKESKGWRNIYHHHHPESKKIKSSEANSGSIHPYGR